MNTFRFLSTFLNEQDLSYAKSTVSKEVDGDKIKKTETEFSGNVKGRADKKGFTEKDADPSQLAMGIEVEKEHSDDPTITKKIALDHLSEIPDYYTRLKNMEDDAKGTIS